jgi:hypothetical protein
MNFDAQHVISLPTRGPLPYEENPQVPYPPVPQSFINDFGGGPVPRGTPAAQTLSGQKPVRAHNVIHPEGISGFKNEPAADGSYMSNDDHGWYMLSSGEIKPCTLKYRGFAWHQNANAPYGKMKMHTL